MDLTSLERSRGCLIGAAYGDMLGAGVEFLSLAEIRRKFGPHGITVPVPAFGHPHPVVTDDTQMAMATAHGILRTPRESLDDDATLLYNIWTEYRAWYASQQNPAERRGPGSTCLGALATGKMGSVTAPLNHSAGCGGIMRAHPVGIAFRSDSMRSFNVGVASAALTHGHSDGYLPAGILANCISRMLRGQRPEDCFSKDMRCVMLAKSPIDGDYGKTIDAAVGQTPGKGGGWLGHDCLDIATFAVFVAPDDPLYAVQIAVNHSGDSDSTGSVAGAMMGALHGPQPFLDELAQHGIALEHQDELEQLAEALHAISE